MLDPRGPVPAPRWRSPPPATGQRAGRCRRGGAGPGTPGGPCVSDVTYQRDTQLWAKTLNKTETTLSPRLPDTSRSLENSGQVETSSSHAQGLCVTTESGSGIDSTQFITKRVFTKEREREERFQTRVRGGILHSLLRVCSQHHREITISSPTHGKATTHPVTMKPRGTPRVYGVPRLGGPEQLGV